MDPESSSPRTVKPAACYARKSTADDIGVTRQMELCRERAAVDGYVIPDNSLFSFGDDMTSGAAATRLDFDRLIDLVASGDAPFGMVFVKDQTRFGRYDDPGEHFVNLHRLMKAGVKVTFLSSSNSYDPTNGGEFMAEAARAYFAREERQALISRVTGGLVGSVSKGLYPGNPLFGLQRWYACKRSAEARAPVDEARVAPGKDESYVLRWAEDGSLDTVRAMFEWCAEGQSLRAIARRLVEDPKVLNVNGKRSWSANTVRGILRNPIYQGDLLWRREEACHPLDDPEVVEGVRDAMLGCRKPFRVRGFLSDPPVSADLFRNVQDVLDGNRNAHGKRVGRKRSSPRHLLSGVVICTICGGRYHGFTSRGGLHYYRHGRVPQDQPNCLAKNRYRRAETLDGPVQELVSELLMEDRFADAARRAVQDVVAREDARTSEREHEAIVRERKAIEGRIDRLSDELGCLTSPAALDRLRKSIDGMGRKLDVLQERERSLGNRSRELLEVERSLPALSVAATRLAEAFNSGDPVARQNTVKEIVRSVRVTPDQDEAEVEVVLPRP